MLIALGLVVGILAICYGAGASLLQALRMTSVESWGERIVYATAIGILLLVNVLFILGISGYLYESVLWGMFLLCGLLTARHIAALFLQLWHELRQWSFTSYSFFEKLLLLCLALFALVYVAMALSPPAQGYAIHTILPVAQMYARAHQIYFIPYEFALRPHNPIMLYVVGVLLQGEILAQLFNYALMALASILLYTTSRQYVSRKYALLAVAIFYTMPLIGIVATTISAEAGVVLYGFLAFCAFLRWQNRLQVHWLLLAGVFSGFCTGFKIVGTEVPFLLGIFILFWGWKARYGSRKLSPIIAWLLSLTIFALATVFTGFPSYLLTYIWTGEPLYSGSTFQKGRSIEVFFDRYLSESPAQKGQQPSGTSTDVLSSKDDRTTPDAAQNQQRNTISTPPKPSVIHSYFQAFLHYLRQFGPQEIVQLAWRMSMTRDRKQRIISPLYLAFIPLLLVFPLKHTHTYIIFVFGLAYCLLGVNLWGDYNRYIIPVFPILALSVAIVVQRLQSENRLIARVSQYACLLMICLYLPAIAHAGINHFPMALGVMDSDTYLQKHHAGTFQVAQYTNKRLPDTAKLLLLGEYKLFLFQRDSLVSGRFSLVMRYPHFRDPDLAYQRLQRLGVTHLILNQQESNNTGYADPDKFIETFQGKYLQLLYHDSDVFLYEMKRQN